MKNKTLKAVAYLRTSSATNVEGDSSERQLLAVKAYAKAAGIEIVDVYTDDAVRGADMIETRPGFKAMLDRLLANGVKTIVVETANRFARDLMVQEVGHAMLKERGIELIAADKPDAFLDDGPTATLIRQVLGAVSQFEKAMLVSKLKGARDRKSAKSGRRIEGRKPHHKLRPEVVTEAKKLHKRGLPLRTIAAELFALGHTNAKGRPFSAQSVQNMLD